MIKDKNGIIIGCQTCKHLNKDTSMSCTAFPTGIPQMVMDGLIAHDEILPYQFDSIIWEPTENAITKSKFINQLED